MNTRKLSLILIWGGLAVVVLAGVWFLTAFASLMDTLGSFGGTEYASKFFSCLYSSPPICQGAGFWSDGPTYSPAVFWIGALAFVAGVILRFVIVQPGSGGTGGTASAAGADAAASAGGNVDTAAPADGNLMGLIPAHRYVTVTYIVALVSVLFMPLVLVTLVLCLLGLFAFRPRLSTLDGGHLAAICAVSAAVLVLRFILPNGVLWLLLLLVQLVLYYVGFNSYRHGRAIAFDNLGEEARLAAKPIVDRLSGGAGR